MDWSSFLAAQNVMTIGAFLLIAIVLFAVFLRRRSNREAAKNAFSGDPERSALARKAERTKRPTGTPEDRRGPAKPPRR
ncbi:MAG: hypothetical protein ACFE0R_11945 [Salinarimonas sp.]